MTESTQTRQERIERAAEYVESQRMPGQSYYLALNTALYYEGTDPMSCDLGRRFGLASMTDRDDILRAAGKGVS